ncbi:F0F1 ATP synthase subunit epsilon [Veillonella criceti]|uniref:ATP synthase epsilon chain n=1 Tax=Veillonella criceti TaxID=103891 RepID=A0A380NKS3_9FIRM|nr:F0F1 ATP synthase subunit epsilon [Veillonella criceti]SUP43551.1 F-ATPase epsilon subunit [Veillonella criceti]
MSSGKTMHLNIITPDSTVYTGEVSFIVARTELGDLGILPRHANLVAALEIAPLRIDTTDGKKTYLANFGGFLEIKDNSVTIVTPNCELPEDIDVERAKRAKARAEERLHSKSADIDFDRARLALQRSLLRLDIKNKVG